MKLIHQANVFELSQNERDVLFILFASESFLVNGRSVEQTKLLGQWSTLLAHASLVNTFVLSDEHCRLVFDIIRARLSTLSKEPITQRNAYEQTHLASIATVLADVVSANT